MNMKRTVTHSTQALSKPWALFAWVENPPVAMVAKAWQTASNRFIPPSSSSRTSASVTPA